MITDREKFYLPVLAGVVILSFVLALSGFAVNGQPAVVVPTPTVINVIVVPTPEASTESVLAALRSELPSFDEFRTQLPAVETAPGPVMASVAPPPPAPVQSSGIQERTYLDAYGNTVLQRWQDVDGQRWLEAGTGNWLPCSMILAGDVPNWGEWPEVFRANMEATCNAG